ELELTPPIPLRGVAHGDPLPAIPQQHVAGAVLARRDRALEAAVVERMVLDVHREALLGRIEARALRHGPALQHAIHLQTKVVVQAAGGVTLDDEAPARGVGKGPRGLRRAAEVAFAVVL